MDGNKQSTVVPQSKEAVGQEKPPVLHVQTGMRAGGFFDDFYNQWQSASADANAADRSTGAGRWI